MDRSDCTELNFITKASNLPSILAMGILSYNRAASVGHQSVANEEVQLRRAAVTVTNGLNLHDYANLYVNARNPMMYVLCSDDAELVVLRIDPAILDIQGVVLSDMNAARNLVRFGPAEEILPLLKRERIFTEYWTHEDPFDRDRHKGEMCAEVLVPNVVPVEYVTGIYVSCESTRKSVSQMCDTLPIVVDPIRFFKGGKG